MTQHTPGPWVTDNGHAERDGIQIWDSVHGWIIADVVNDQHGNGEANAALIAAAPETAAERDRLRQVNEAMLEALRKLSVDAAIFTRTMPESGGSRAYWAEMRRRLIISNTEVQAVIAAAEGK